jgi:GH24 family phage-related lysozyme (muramidase)
MMADADVTPPAIVAPVAPDAVIANLKRWEWSTTWLYLDSSKYPTVGIGCMIPTVEEAQKYPWKIGDHAASALDIAFGYNSIKAHAGQNLRASAYADVSDLRLSQEDVEAIARIKIGEVARALHGMWPMFDQFPVSAQFAIYDMAWNLGVAGLSKFEHLCEAITARDWKAAARSCHRKTCREERNEWTSAHFYVADERTS